MTQTSRPLLRSEMVDHITIVSFLEARIITDEEVQSVAETLYSLVKDRGRKRLLLDFGEVEKLSSSALGVLMTLKKRLDMVQGEMGFYGIRPQLMVIFKVTGLDRIFPIFKDECEALDQF